MKITKFRPVREFLAEAMTEIFEFEKKEELITHLNDKKTLLSTPIKETDISFSPYATDTRMKDWRYTYLVLYQNHTPIGYTNNIPI